MLGEGCVLGGVCAGAGAGLGVLGEGCVQGQAWECWGRGVCGKL